MHGELTHRNIVAFVTPILLSKSSSGAYFLFGGAILLTLLVSIDWHFLKNEAVRQQTNVSQMTICVSNSYLDLLGWFLTMSEILWMGTDLPFKLSKRRCWYHHFISGNHDGGKSEWLACSPGQTKEAANGCPHVSEWIHRTSKPHIFILILLSPEFAHLLLSPKPLPHCNPYGISEHSQWQSVLAPN